MTEEELTALLDRAAGTARPDDALPARAEARGRRLIARRRAAAATAVAVAVAAVVSAGVLRLPQREPGVPTATPAGDVLRRFTEAQAVPVADVLVAETAGDYAVAVVRRDANAAEAAYGGKAAQLWVSRDGGAFRQVSDYLSYDFACPAGDAVCEAVRPDIGFFAVVTTDPGRALAVVSVPPDRSVRGFTGDGARRPAGGRVTEIAVNRPTDLQARVATADGQEYGIPLPPGGVVAGA